MKRIYIITAYILFSAYSAIMLYLLFFQRIGWNSEWLKTSANLVPFKTVSEFIEVLNNSQSAAAFSVRHAIRNLVGNIILFVPLGLFLPLLFKRQRKFSVYFLSVFLLILSIETAQLITSLGSFDIDDLILNMLGASLGYIIFKIIRTHKLKAKP